MANQLRIIRVKFEGNDEALKGIASSVKGLNQQLSKTNNYLGGFQSAFQAIAGASFLGVGISQVTDLADSYSLLFDRIKVLTGSSENAKSAFSGLSEVAKQNKSSIEGAATVYARLAAATNDLGLSQNQVIQTTDLLLKSFRISGATTTEATSSTVQLSQALASGALRGQELRSVLEANVVFGELLAREFGVTRGELIKLGETGAFTSDRVLKALFNAEDELTRKSKELGVTFAQVADQIKNDLFVAVGELSKELDAAGKLARGVDYLKQNLPELKVAIIGFASALGALKLAAAGTATVLATIGGVLSSPLVIAGAVGAALFVLAKNFDTIAVRIRTTIYDTLSGLLSIIRLPFGKFDSIAKPLEEAIASLDFQSKLYTDTLKKSSETTEEHIFTQKDFRKEILNTVPAKQKDKNATNEMRDAVAELNKQYNTTSMTLDEYNKKLYQIEYKRLSRDLKEGKLNLNSFNEKLRELDFENSRRQYESGTLSLKDFNAVIKANELQTLDEKFKSGKINLDEYNKSLIGLKNNFDLNNSLYVGTSDFLQSIGTVSQNVATAITGTFSRLEDALVDFTTKGKFSFKQFSMAVIEDINRIILRALIIRPLAQGILGAIGSSPSGAYDASTNSSGMGDLRASDRYAKGGAFNRGVEFFASGGVVQGATAFGMRNGKTGIMGEAGPEAIMPLKRGPNGSLGVEAAGMGSNVVVNIINQSGNEVQQTESTAPDGTKMIDVLITAKVKEGIARGDFDRTFGAAYGLRRKGT